MQTHTISRELCQRLRRLKTAMHGTLGTPPLTQADRSFHLSLKKQAQSSGKCLTISPAPFPALLQRPFPPFFLPVRVGSTKPWNAATFPPPAIPSCSCRRLETFSVWDPQQPQWAETQVTFPLTQVSRLLPAPQLPACRGLSSLLSPC